MTIVVWQKQPVQTTQGTLTENMRQQEHFGQSGVITHTSINQRRSTDNQDGSGQLQQSIELQAMTMHVRTATITYTVPQLMKTLDFTFT